MAQMNMIQALNSAMDVMMARDPSVVVDGRGRRLLRRRVPRDRRPAAQIRRASRARLADLRRRHRRHRHRHGVNGLNPVAEIQFADYIYPAYDQIVSELARIRYRTGGEFNAPVMIRTPCGGGIRGGQTHSQSPEAMFTHVCGIKVVMPSNPYDAKGLLIAAIEDDDPVIFFEPKRLYNGPFDGDPNKPAVPWSTHPKGDVPEGHYRVPIGKCEIVRPGKQITIVTYGTMVHVCERRGQKLDIDAEIIDVRTIVPLDMTRSALPSRRPAAAWSRTRRRASRASARRFLRASRKSASGTSKRRSSASPAGTRRIRTRSNGSIFPARRASRRTAGNDGGEHEPHVLKLPDLGEGTVSAESSRGT